ncbi:hypothetical protein [Streptomyces sp. ECR3.8]|uniref:hypothetical protein n=1 Tax=Streptomyces sp. ECR3.8 TaxID=3461009 RepID=UPI0040415C4A
MTQTEIVLFVSGLLIGAQIMAVIVMVLDLRDARRDLALAEKHRRRAAADRFLDSFRRYQLENRPPLLRPYPPTEVEAVARDLELSLYDALDRIEGAARKDGLL